MWEDAEHSIICPDFDQDTPVPLLGDGDAAEVIQLLLFQVKLCINDGDKMTGCKPEKEVKEFVRDIIIDSWTSFYKIDFNHYNV